MKLATAIVAALSLVACGGGDDDDGGGVSLDAPTCQQAMTHYYESGCAFSGDLGQLTVEQAVSFCTDVLIDVSGVESCELAFDYWRICLDSVPADSTTFGQCDCSPEQEGVITCG